MEVDWQIGERGDYIGRRHRYQLERETCRNRLMRNKFLLNQYAKTWNFLPSDIVEANMVDSFKTRTDRHMEIDALRRSVYKV